MPDVNIFGKYPVCKPVVGDITSRCERCGGYAGRDLPCPAIPPEKRWGENSGEWLLVTVQSRLGDSVQLAGNSRINGASFKSPALQYASPGETWAIYWTQGVGLFGRIEFAFNLHPLPGPPDDACCPECGESAAWCPCKHCKGAGTANCECEGMGGRWFCPYGCESYK